MMKLNIEIQETDDGMQTQINGGPAEDGKKATRREFKFAKEISDFISANAKKLLRLAELEAEKGNEMSALAESFKKAVMNVYDLTEEEFSDAIKDAKDGRDLKAKLDAIKAGKQSEGHDPAESEKGYEPAEPEKKPAEKEPCDLAEVEETVKQELENLPTGVDEKPDEPAG